MSSSIIGKIANEARIETWMCHNTRAPLVLEVVRRRRDQDKQEYDQLLHQQAHRPVHHSAKQQGALNGPVNKDFPTLMLRLHLRFPIGDWW